MTATTDLQGDGAEAPPLIIWTFRRTGGTSLRGILFWLSGRDSLQDEAFNDDPPRQLGHITSAYRVSQDEAALRAGVRAAMAGRPNLKHCIENVPFRLNSVLVEETAALGYQNVVLLRLNEVERQISLEMALALGAWGPDEAREIYEEVRAGRQAVPPLRTKVMERQAESDAAALGKLVRLFMINGIVPITVFFEALYAGDKPTRCAAFRRLAAAVGIPGAAALADDVFHKAAIESGQDSASMKTFFPNYAAASAALADVIR
jgi:hypothetical protein